MEPAITAPTFQKTAFKRRKDDLLFIVGQQPDVVDIVTYDDPNQPYHYRIANARLLNTWATYLAARKYQDANAFWVQNVKLVAKGGASHALGKLMAPVGYGMFSRSSRIILAKNHGKNTEAWAVLYEVSPTHPGDANVLYKIGKRFTLVPSTFWPRQGQLNSKL